MPGLKAACEKRRPPVVSVLLHGQFLQAVPADEESIFAEDAVINHAGPKWYSPFPKANL